MLMRYRILLLMILVPVLLQAQRLVRCDDTISWFLGVKGDRYFTVKLTGVVKPTENPQMVNYNGSPVQFLYTDTTDYIGNGPKETQILATYITNETEYFSGLFGQRLNMMMDPVRLDVNRLAVVWYFDIPEEYQSPEEGDSRPAVRMVSISSIYESRILSVGTTQFRDEPFEASKALVMKLLRACKTGSGSPDNLDVCR